MDNPRDSKICNLIRNSEKMYHANRFKLAEGNMRDTWKLINNILRDTCSIGSKPTITEITYNNKTITDPKKLQTDLMNFSQPLAVS